MKKYILLIDDPHGEVILKYFDDLIEVYQFVCDELTYEDFDIEDFMPGGSSGYSCVEERIEEHEACYDLFENGEEHSVISLTGEEGSWNNFTNFCFNEKPIKENNKNKMLKFDQFNEGVFRKSVRKTKDEFIEDARHIHGDEYDYSLVDYKNNKTKVKIICPKHGIFNQTPGDHTLSRSKCPKCLNRNRGVDDFVRDARKLHGDLYDYSLVKYVNAHNKVDIICKKHGPFSMSYNSHITKGYCCPVCNETSGEILVKKFLSENNIRFVYQKRFDDCKHIRYLSFDFYLPDKNLIIEYDGRHHFMPIWGGEEGFNLIKKRDSIKTKYCIDNNIKLIRIKFNDKIENKLNEIL